MSGLRIGVDIDDVLTGWYARAHEISVDAGITNGKTPTSWAPFNEYGCTDQEWYDVLSVATLDGRLYSTEPYAGVVEALQRRDIPVVEAGVLLVAVMYVGLNLVVDILYGWVDPRVRYA